METLTTFRRDNPGLLRTLGIAAVAAAAGGISGIVLSKAVLATKGAALAQGALAAKSGGAASAGASLLPALVQQGSAAAGQAARSLTPAALGASLNSVPSLVSQTVAGGVPLTDKMMTLWHVLSRNALPLTTGVVGGGVATVQIMKRRVHHIEDALSEQVVQTETAQTEAVRMQSELTEAETNLRDLQAKLDALSTQRPTPQDSLVKIQGIGRVFAERLNAAGIYTFAELAAQTPDAVRDIIGTTRGGAMADPEAWIVEAQQLADSR